MVSPTAQAGLLVQAQIAATQVAPALTATPTPVQAGTTAEAGRGSWSFFKSPVGIAVISTFAVGVGYFLYSTQHDRVNSPGKE
jgi:hypothetical protein